MSPSYLYRPTIPSMYHVYIVNLNLQLGVHEHWQKKISANLNVSNFAALFLYNLSLISLIRHCSRILRLYLSGSISDR